jgi:hypothetical protein
MNKNSSEGVLLFLTRTLIQLEMYRGNLLKTFYKEFIDKKII